MLYFAKIEPFALCFQPSSNSQTSSSTAPATNSVEKATLSSSKKFPWNFYCCWPNRMAVSSAATKSKSASGEKKSLWTPNTASIPPFGKSVRFSG